MARKRSGLVALTALVALVTGCQKDRPLSFEPHVYQGERAAALTEQQQHDLEERGKLQR